MLRDEIFELRRLLGENVPEIEKILEKKKPAETRSAQWGDPNQSLTKSKTLGR
jgi:hypothetical protein